MGQTGASSRRVSLADAADRTVGDVMIPSPKSLPADARVADVRRAFQRPSVRTVLLTDGQRFAGAIERSGLPVNAADDQPAIGFVQSDPLTVTPGLSMREAVRLLARRGEPRLIVLDPDGVTLRGLLCANGDATGFCVR